MRLPFHEGADHFLGSFSSDSLLLFENKFARAAWKDTLRDHAPFENYPATAEASRSRLKVD